MLQNLGPNRETKIAVLQKLRADCEDASSELMLVDEEQVSSLEQQQSTDRTYANALHGIGDANHDVQVRYVLGECFIHATPEEAEEKLQSSTCLALLRFR